MMPRLFTADVFLWRRRGADHDTGFNDAAAVHRGCLAPLDAVLAPERASMMPRLFTADVARGGSVIAPPVARFNDAAAVHRGCLEGLAIYNLLREHASMMPRLFTADVAQQFRRQVIHLLASMMPRLFTADVPSSCGVWGAMERLQ